MNFLPEHVKLWTIWPALDSATRSRTRIRMLVHPSLREDEGAVRRLAKSQAIIDQALVQEDWRMAEAIQASVSNGDVDSILVGRADTLIQAFHAALDDELDGLGDAAHLPTRDVAASPVLDGR